MFHPSVFSAAPIAANGALPDPNKEKEKDIDDGGGRRGEIAGEDDGSTYLMQVKTLKSIEDVNEFSSAGVHGVLSLSPTQHIIL